MKYKVFYYPGLWPPLLHRRGTYPPFYLLPFTFYLLPDKPVTL